MDNVPDINNSNKEIITLIENEKPFTVVRVAQETDVTVEYKFTKKIKEHYLYHLSNNAGIYFKDDISSIEKFCELHYNAIEKSNLLACFNMPQHFKKQNFFSSKYKLKKIHARSLEPFYACLENLKPWTLYLHNKKVLIIHPFVESFKKQIENNFSIFKDKDIFHPDQEFKFYKSFQTIAGNHIHNNWFDTFSIMCDEIKKIDFDIALLGCGGYGLPLCEFIKSELGKSAIYIGGGLQLLFGVMGNRWENREDWKKIIKENECKFIRPSGSEIPENCKHVEYGCYW